jgi:hypothetical protein
VPPPSVPRPEPAFSRDDETHGIRRYWRGPTWVNSARSLWLGLVRLGYSERATVLSTRLGEAVIAAGLREYQTRSMATAWARPPSRGRA